MSCESDVVVVAEKPKGSPVIFDSKDMTAEVEGWMYYIVFISSVYMEKNKELITCGNLMPFAKTVGRYNLRRDNCGMHSLMAFFEKEKYAEELCKVFKSCNKTDMSIVLHKRKYYLALQVEHSLLSREGSVKRGDIIPIFAV